MSSGTPNANILPPKQGQACPEALTANASEALCEERSGDLAEFVSDIVDKMPGKGSQGFINPSPEQLLTWRELVKAFAAKDWPTLATRLSETKNYQMLVFNDSKTQKAYPILAERDPISLGWGTYIQNPEAKRNLNIHVNHPLYDRNTWKIGTALFQQSAAHYLFLAGTHRFANGSGEFVESDTARNRQGPFQVVHEIVSQKDDLTVSIHGFTHDTKYSPEINTSDVILSAGAPEVPSIVTHLEKSLRQHGLLPGVYDGGPSYKDLSGGVNPQGQYSNKTYGAGQFVHVEIEQKYRQDDGLLTTLVSGLKSGLDAYFAE